jgi:hypothetical protein
MKTYLCSVRLAGSMQHVTTNKRVTVSEIAVLRRVHGDDAVMDVRPAGDVARSDTEERERLRKTYDNATPDAEPLVDRLFGALGKLPTSLAQVGIDPKAQAESLRRQAEQLSAAAEALNDEPEVDSLFGDDED